MHRLLAISKLQNFITARIQLRTVPWYILIMIPLLPLWHYNFNFPLSYCLLFYYCTVYSQCCIILVFIYQFCNRYLFLQYCTQEYKDCYSVDSHADIGSFNSHLLNTSVKPSNAHKIKVSSCRPSEPALGCLDTTQALRAGASKSTWRRANTLQVTLRHAPGWRCGHPKFHLDLTH